MIELLKSSIGFARIENHALHYLTHSYSPTHWVEILSNVIRKGALFFPYICVFTIFMKQIHIQCNAMQCDSIKDLTQFQVENTHMKVTRFPQLL